MAKATSIIAVLATLALESRLAGMKASATNAVTALLQSGDVDSMKAGVNVTVELDAQPAFTVWVEKTLGLYCKSSGDNQMTIFLEDPSPKKRAVPKKAEKPATSK